MLTTRVFVWAALFILLCLFAAKTLIAADVEPLAPHVLGVEPFPGSEIRPDEPLVFVFDQPMLPDSVSLSFEPALTGQVTWIDPGQMAFRPEGGRWAADQQYRVTLMAQAETGRALDDPFQIVIQTQRSLVVTSVSPERDARDVDIRSPITISFDRPMIPLASTQEQDDLPSPLTFEPALEGEGEWVNSSVYRFTPTKEGLTNTTLYTVSVISEVTAIDGAAFAEPYEWSFRTAAPTVNYVGWNENDDPTTTVVKRDSGSSSAGPNALSAGVGVVFNQPMEHTSTE